MAARGLAERRGRARGAHFRLRPPPPPAPPCAVPHTRGCVSPAPAVRPLGAAPRRLLRGCPGARQLGARFKTASSLARSHRPFPAPPPPPPRHVCRATRTTRQRRMLSAAARGRGTTWGSHSLTLCPSPPPPPSSPATTSPPAATTPPTGGESSCLTPSGAPAGLPVEGVRAHGLCSFVCTHDTHRAWLDPC